MARDTAAIVGKTGSKVVITFDPTPPSSATWNNAPGGTQDPQKVGNTIVIPSLPAGDATLRVVVVVPPSGCEARFVSGDGYVILAARPAASPTFDIGLFGE